MSKQDTGGSSQGYFTLLVGVVDVSRQKDDTVLVVFRDENGVRVTIELRDSAAHTLTEKVSEVLQSA